MPEGFVDISFHQKIDYYLCHIFGMSNDIPWASAKSLVAKNENKLCTKGHVEMSHGTSLASAIFGRKLKNSLCAKKQD